jgi:nucleotide-binding universal stress UspA family protein
MFKDLLLVNLCDACNAAPNRISEELARHFSAHLRIGLSVDLPVVAVQDMGGFAPTVYAPLLDQARQTAEQRAQKLREKFSASDIQPEIFLFETQPAYTVSPVSMHAHYADCSIMLSESVPEAAPFHRLHLQSLLMDSGRPVILIPAQCSARVPPQYVVIAWSPTREAARAIHDALPLLLKASRVDVLIIDPKVGVNAHGSEPGADIATHLARHGLKVNVVTRPRINQSTGASILQYAESNAADLIVSGAYGHSRLRELVFGGVTRELIKTSKVPVLLSH